MNLALFRRSWELCSERNTNTQGRGERSVGNMEQCGWVESDSGNIRCTSKPMKSKHMRHGKGTSMRVVLKIRNPVEHPQLLQQDTCRRTVLLEVWPCPWNHRWSHHRRTWWAKLFGSSKKSIAVVRKTPANIYKTSNCRWILNINWSSLASSWSPTCLSPSSKWCSWNWLFHGEKH